MARVDALELSKNSARTNEHDRILDTPFISYGVIIEVIDIQTVIVETVVQTTLAKEVYTVSLLSLSSKLYEMSVIPEVNDLVLLLFLQHRHIRMFEDVDRRMAGGEERTIYDRNADGYNRFSGVGILMTTVKSAAATTIRHEMEGSIPAINARTTAKLTTEFNRAVTLVFNSIPDTSDETPESEPVSVTFGEQSPFGIEHWAAVKRIHGMMRKINGEQVELDAPVDETYSIYSPITKDIQGTQTKNVGLGKDKEGSPVETDASITETIHGKAPIARDIRSPQNITIGIGNDETEDPSEQREAPVTIEMGENADIDFNSQSGIAASIAKDVDVLVGGNETRNIEGDKEEAVTGKAKYSSADTDIESTAPVGINDGLYKTGLQPYLNSETDALIALQAAATSANPQLAVLDGLSGGTGFITGLGTAIIKFCTSMQSADTDAHTSISKAVK
jgi:hypothetical protein